MPHIQVLASYWTPICLAALHRYGRTANRAWAIVAAVAWLMQALSCGYYLFFLSVLLALWVLWFAVGRWSVRSSSSSLSLFAVAALAAGAVPARIPGDPPRHLRLHAIARRDPPLQRGRRGLAACERRAARVGLGARRRARGVDALPGAHHRRCWPVLAIVQARPFGTSENETRRVRSATPGAHGALCCARWSARRFRSCTDRGA